MKYYKATNIKDGTTFKGFTLARIDDMIYNHMMDNKGLNSDWIVIQCGKED